VESMVIKELKNEAPVVYVVDDDPQSQQDVVELVHSFGHQVRSFDTPDALLENVDEKRPGCVVLDLRLPGVDGPEIYRQLLERGVPLPVVALTANANTGSTVRLLRNGAVCVLDKPCRDDELWNCIQKGISGSEQDRRRLQYRKSLERRLRRLSPSDRNVLQLMLQGVKNRSIANRLEVSLRTVENRRRRVFEIMQADSLAQLTRMIVEYEHNLLPSEKLQDCWLTLPFDRSTTKTESTEVAS